MLKLIDPAYQLKYFEKKLFSTLNEIILNSKFIGGLHLKKFEEEFAKFNNCNYCIGVANGTDALEIALSSLNLKKKSKILVPCNSFIATAEAVIRCGFEPVFIEYDYDTFVINAEIVKKYISNEVSAIIAVHLYGQAVDIDSIKKITKNKIKIIEDCAQAHGASYKGKKVGSIGDIGCFSFFPSKNLGAFGDGGCITLNNKKLAETCRRISNHGRLHKFDHKIIGRNSRLDNINAAILRLKLKHLNKWNRVRYLNAITYDKLLNSKKLISKPKIINQEEHVFHHYVIRIKKRDKIKKLLKKNNIETGIHYPKLIPCYKSFNASSWKSKDEGHLLLSLPVAEHVSKDKIKKISSIINLA